MSLKNKQKIMSNTMSGQHTVRRSVSDAAQPCATLVHGRFSPPKSPYLANIEDYTEKRHLESLAHHERVRMQVWSNVWHWLIITDRSIIQLENNNCAKRKRLDVESVEEVEKKRISAKLTEIAQKDTLTHRQKCYMYITELQKHTRECDDTDCL